MSGGRSAGQRVARASGRNSLWLNVRSGSIQGLTFKARHNAGNIRILLSKFGTDQHVLPLNIPRFAAHILQVVST